MYKCPSFEKNVSSNSYKAYDIRAVYVSKINEVKKTTHTHTHKRIIMLNLETQKTHSKNKIKPNIRHRDNGQVEGKKH